MIFLGIFGALHISEQLFCDQWIKKFLFELYAFMESQLNVEQRRHKRNHAKSCIGRVCLIELIGIEVSLVLFLGRKFRCQVLF